MARCTRPRSKRKFLLRAQHLIGCVAHPLRCDMIVGRSTWEQGIPYNPNDPTLKIRKVIGAIGNLTRLTGGTVMPASRLPLCHPPFRVELPIGWIFLVSLQLAGKMLHDSSEGILCLLCCLDRRKRNLYTNLFLDLHFAKLMVMPIGRVGGQYSPSYHVPWSRGMYANGMQVRVAH